MAVNRTSLVNGDFTLTIGKISTMNFQLDSTLIFLLGMSLILFAFLQEKLYLFLLCDKMHYHPEKLCNQNSINRMRKLSWISMDT